MGFQLVSELPKLAPRKADSNKGSYGSVLILAGSRGMSGAAILAGSAALRAGAGLVRVAVPTDILPIVALGNPCYMTLPLPQDMAGRLGKVALADLMPLIEKNDVFAIGPGLGHSDTIGQLLRQLLVQVRIPIVLDADGLNAFAGHAADLGKHAGPLVITPHPGEFARLLGTDVESVQLDRRQSAATFARDHRLIVVLKGHGTIVTDGKRIYQNTTGNPGMATGGTGDVLTGVISALLGQGLDPFAAAQLGVYLHGLAGDLAKADLGEEGLIASDLIDRLPRAFVKYRLDS